MWRSLFLGTLMILCFLTFETILAGLERSNNNQTLPMLEIKADQRETSAEIVILKAKVDEIQSIDTEKINSEFNTSEENAYSVFESQLSEVEETRKNEIDQITNLEEEQTSSYRVSASTSEDALKKQLDSRESLLSNLRADLTNQQKSIRDDANRKIEFQNNILNNLSEQRKDARDKTNQGFGGGGSRQRFAEEEAEIDEKESIANKNIESIQKYERDELLRTSENFDEEIESITKEIEDIEKQISEKSEDAEKSFEAIMKNLNERRSSINQRADQERERFSKQYDDAKILREGIYQQQIAEVNKKRENLESFELMLDQAEEALITIKKDVSRIANQVVVIRFAKIWYGLDSSADVTNKMERSVILVWFGSIALIASITGTVIAFASFLLVDRDAFTPKQKKTPRRVISNAVRRLLIRRRMFYRSKSRGAFTYLLDSVGEAFQALKDRLLRPVIRKEYIEKEVEKIVEVTKEIPVEKIVIKEVPKEIVRKEMIYVPFYSSDGGTLDISGQISDLTSAEDIKMKIKEITKNMTTEKSKEDDHDE